MKGDRETCMRAGMTDYLSKPINWSALSTLLINLREGNEEPES